MSPTQAAGYKVRIDTSPPPVNKFCFSIARGLSRVKMLVKGENGYGILFPLRERIKRFDFDSGRH